ncbi:MAG TPA: catalase-peroxidase, partial [Oceanithermus profundus]|nr:catalase-peroxidase [Oceanithermus profundus]
MASEAESKCLVTGDAYKHTTLGGSLVRNWWPNQLNLKILQQSPAELRPTDPDFNYAGVFAKLELEAVKQDLRELMTTSQDW